MSKKPVRSSKIYTPPRRGAFSAAVEVTVPGRTIYVSGLTSRNERGEIVGKEDIKAQTETVLENLKTVLESAGATLDDIVKLTVFVVDIEQFDEIHEVRRRYFSEPYPASTMVEVSRLVDPELLIEIEAVAVVE